MENTTTIRRIADRLMRHPLMRDIPFETIIDYTVDFLQILGCPQAYIDKTKVLKIEDYRALLPCDYIEMVQVRNYIDPADLTSDRVYPIIYRYATDSFHLSDNKYESLNPQKEFTYTIQGSVIFTSLKEGYIEIVYRAIATDDEGYPLLPDHTKFLKALELYIKKEWFTVLFDMNKITQNVYQQTCQDYCWAVGQCNSAMHNLTLDKAESIFNLWSSLFLKTNEHKYGYVHTGSKEYNKIHP